MVPRPLAAARAMRSRTRADVIQPCYACWFKERRTQKLKRLTRNICFFLNLALNYNCLLQVTFLKTLLYFTLVVLESLKLDEGVIF